MPKKKLYILTFLLLYSPVSITKEINKFVHTSSGQVQGYLEKKVINYDDIPYAKPPVGSLRWKAPRKIDNPSHAIIPKENNFCVAGKASIDIFLNLTL